MINDLFTAQEVLALREMGEIPGTHHGYESLELRASVTKLNIAYRLIKEIDEEIEDLAKVT